MSTIYEYNTTPSLWENYAKGVSRPKTQGEAGFHHVRR
jgi:hypothetical protein